MESRYSYRIPWHHFPKEFLDLAVMRIRFELTHGQQHRNNVVLFKLDDRSLAGIKNENRASSGPVTVLNCISYCFMTRTARRSSSGITGFKK